MGASNINLVDPIKTGLHADNIAISRAAGAKDVLESSVETTFEKATENSNYVVAFSSRKREIQPPNIEFNGMIKKVVKLLISSSKYKVSMVFGGERVGLHNQDLIKCTHVCKFDVSPVYSSLNLSHAVQVVAYALRMELISQFLIFLKANQVFDRDNEGHKLNLDNSCITQKEIFSLKRSFLELTADIGLIKPGKKGRIEDRISRILVTSNLSENDFKLLHSFFALVKKKLKDKT
jgi:TrmH family RNA methyltransferase